jgi:hypothetical protein
MQCVQDRNKPHLTGAIEFAYIDMENKLRELGDQCPLDLEEAAAINLYTQETPVYGILNARLRDDDRDPLKPFFPYLHLLVSGLHKLLAHQGMQPRAVYRGVTLDLTAHFAEDSKKVWWSPSSTSAVVVCVPHCSFLCIFFIIFFFFYRNVWKKHALLSTLALIFRVGYEFTLNCFRKPWRKISTVASKAIVRFLPLRLGTQCASPTFRPTTTNKSGCCCRAPA